MAISELWHLALISFILTSKWLIWPWLAGWLQRQIIYYNFLCSIPISGWPNDPVTSLVLVYFFKLVDNECKCCFNYALSPSVYSIKGVSPAKIMTFYCLNWKRKKKIFCFKKIKIKIRCKKWLMMDFLTCSSVGLAWNDFVVVVML